MVELAGILAYLYPTAVPLRDYEVCDQSDGSGPRITRWDSVVLGPQPAVAELEAASVAEGYQSHLLGLARQARLERAYARTRELEAAGFTFQGHRFGLSGDTQVTWLTLLVGVQTGMISLPKPVGILDNGLFEIPDIATLQAFCSAALARGDAIKSGEADIRHAVYDAATVEAVEAVPDMRE